MMDVDEALLRLGKFNRWRIAVYCMVCASVTVSGCWHMMAIVFIGGEPEHRCQLSDGEALNETIPREWKGSKTRRFSQCKRYVNFTLNNETMPCDKGWHYERTEFRTSIVSDWDLVCDKNYLVEMSQSVFNFGVMVGAIVFTSLADRVGRKPVHLACQYAMLVLGLAIVFSPSYVVFVVLRFLQGAVREGAGLVGIVMACELFPAVHRTFAGTALELFWAAAWMSLALIAYLIREWRYLQLAITLPPGLTIAMIWLVPESVPWLAANDKIDEAESILRQAAASSGVQFPTTHILTRHKKKRSTGASHQLPATTADSSFVSAVGTNPSSTSHSVTSLSTRLSQKLRRKFSTTPESSTSEPSGIIGSPSSTATASTTAATAAATMSGPEMEQLDTQLTCFDLAKSRKMVLYTVIMCSLWYRKLMITDYFIRVGRLSKERVGRIEAPYMADGRFCGTFLMSSCFRPTFASVVVYFGLSLSTSSLAGDKYVNFFLSGAVEAPAYGLTVVVLQKYGRRWPLFIFHTIASVVLFIKLFIPSETESGQDMSALIITLTMIGKFAMTAAFGTVVLYAPEIYPTNLRNFGFGLASVWGRIGGTIAPMFAYIDKTHGWIPTLVFTVVALVTGVMALFLPETLNRPLPETIEEIESWTRDGRPRGPRLTGDGSPAVDQPADLDRENLKKQTDLEMDGIVQQSSAKELQT